MRQAGLFLSSARNSFTELTSDSVRVSVSIRDVIDEGVNGWFAPTRRECICHEDSDATRRPRRAPRSKQTFGGLRDVDLPLEHHHRALPRRAALSLGASFLCQRSPVDDVKRRLYGVPVPVPPRKTDAAHRPRGRVPP